MILTGHSIASAEAWLTYCTQNSKEYEIIEVDGLDSSSNQAMLDDLQLYQNKRLQKPYLSLILAPDRDLSSDKLRQLVEDIRRELKLTENQMIAITHAEKRNMKHVHILINRVNYMDVTFNDSFIGVWCMKIASEVAQKHGLTDVYNNRFKAGNKLGAKENDQNGSHRVELANELREVVKNVMQNEDVRNYPDVIEALQIEYNVEMKITKHKNGSYGVSLSYKDQTFKASHISRLLTLIPDGDTFSPNKAFVKFMDDKFEKEKDDDFANKTLDQLHADFLVHKDFDRLNREMAALMNIYMGGSNKSKENEENEAEFLRKKYGSRKNNTFRL